VILCGKITHIFLLVKALYELFFVRSAILRSPHKGAQSAIEGFVEIIALNEQSPPPMTYAYSVITATMTMYNMTCRCIIYDTRHDVILRDAGRAGHKKRAGGGSPGAVCGFYAVLII
jgi:hypothetical protein